MGRQLMSYDTFVSQANEKHNHKFDYTQTQIISNKTKTTIICPIHGDFEQSIQDHLRSVYGCPMCSKIGRSETRTMHHEEFVVKANSVHNNFYDYSLAHYTHHEDVLDIICPVHETFRQKAFTHLSGKGCVQCYRDRQGDTCRKPTQQFIDEANHIHNSKYDYSLVSYINTHTKVEIVCQQHGIFWQRPMQHIRGVGCPKCKTSKGEQTILAWLERNNIHYECEYMFSDCKHINELPFDFFIPTLNVCIEYDGKQHFQPIKYFGGDEGFKTRQLRDSIKNDYCNDNNIRLLRIPYTEFNNVDTILEKEILTSS